MGCAAKLQVTVLEHIVSRYCDLFVQATTSGPLLMRLESPADVLDDLLDEGLEAILPAGFLDHLEGAGGARRVFRDQRTVRGDVCDVEVHEITPCTGARYVVVIQPARSVPDQRDLRRHFQLTRQQAQVALLLNERRSDREIAQALGIALNTASNHVKMVRDKLSAKSRREIPEIIRALGQPPEPNPQDRID